MMSPDQPPILEVNNLTKTFAGVKALDNVQLRLRQGEVHALMGENGAGKSTFMKILIGLLTPDSGEIWFEGTPLKAATIHEVRQKGIAMIHQEMLNVPELTVAQNIFLGRETSGGLFGWLNDRERNQRAAELLAHLGVSIAPTVKMKHLSVAEMQMVELARALANDVKVLIMDEPTSALADTEAATLFGIIRELTRKGVAILYISHKMEEIFALADTITVLRDGRYIGTHPAGELDENKLIQLMVGRELDQLFPESATQPGQEVLSVSNLGRAGVFSGISFTVRAGEVLGMAGLMGAGRTEVARAIYGLDPVDTGDVFMHGNRVVIHSPQEAIRRGIGYVSEDRKQLGLIPALSIRDNLTLGSVAKHARSGFIRAASEATATAEAMTRLRIKATGPDQPVVYLSGGNQQKVVIGKVLEANPAVVILDEPTRGIDIGAKAEVYKLIRQLKTEGIAILLISSELPELLGLSDRILVLAKGRQTALLTKAEATPETIMHHAMHP